MWLNFRQKDQDRGKNQLLEKIIIVKVEEARNKPLKWAVFALFLPFKEGSCEDVKVKNTSSCREVRCLLLVSCCLSMGTKIVSGFLWRVLKVKVKPQS